MTGPAWNPGGPHSPRRTAQAGDLFDRLSRFLVYATMSRDGVRTPGDAYVLLADVYLAAGRLPQLCGQLAEFLAGQAAAGRLRDDRGRDPAGQCALAAASLRQAAGHAAGLDAALQDAQRHIAGLAVAGHVTGIDYDEDFGDFGGFGDDDDDLAGGFGDDGDDLAGGFEDDFAGGYGDA